ncbi:MAG: response regulator [Deltaproteobacteria bacterium]|nr:response regulator [Deltaproteobacteria bacterium]
MSRVGIVVAAAGAGRRQAIRQVLREAGFRDVALVDSIAAAVGELRRRHVSCVVVAAELADVTGLQGIPILRAADAGVRIIFVASAADVALESAVRALDVFYYHVESDGCADLVGAVSAAVGDPRVTPGRPCVLVVDDDPAFREAARLMLEAFGCRVVGADSAAEALRLARVRRPQLVVADIMMESATDGLQLLREVRRDPALRHTPFVAVSAAPRRAGLDAALVGGEDLSQVDAYLTKPVDSVEFEARVRELLGRGG